MKARAGKPTILVVEDEPRLVRLIETVLRADGYVVRSVISGDQAIESAALESPDLILLDILLAGELDGFEVCRRIREFSSVPIIMLTARVSEPDKLRGFDLGADDYITKPFSAKELLARVGAVLRRSRLPTTSPGRLEIGELTVDLARQQVTVKDKQIPLTPTEYRLLLILAQHPDQVIQHETLLTEVWGQEYRDELTYLRTYIRYLRQKIEPDPKQPRYVISHPGVGYRLASDT